MNQIKCHIFLCSLFSGSELNYLSSVAKAELTYQPFALVKLLLGVNLTANIFRMEKQNITISDECSGFRPQFLRHNRHNRDLARAKINGKFHLFFCGLTFEQIAVHCEICAYSRFCETKELKGENNSVLLLLFSLPPITY